MKRNKAKRAKSLVEGPNPRVPHLALPLELGSEDHHATTQRQLGNHPSALVELRKT